MKTSSMFLRNLTAIDYAIVSKNGNVLGGSLHLSAHVSGSVDPVENVVVDFSTIKKDIKDIIDAKEDGFDHKLWVIEDFSLYNCDFSVDNAETVIITTPTATLGMPRNAVKYIPSKASGWSEIYNAIENQLTEKLNEKHPNTNISVQVQLSSNAFSEDHPYFFHYVHGLKNSTSWGCQNHSHGHRSWMEFRAFNGMDNVDPEAESRLAATINQLNNSIFIWEENIVRMNSSEITIAYETPRGEWFAAYSLPGNNIYIMEEETTIENIVDEFVKTNRNVLEAADVERVFISEGLQKGAYKDL
jgi:uncharacterized protein (UPF0335 family)